MLHNSTLVDANSKIVIRNHSFSETNLQRLLLKAPKSKRAAHRLNQIIKVVINGDGKRRLENAD